MQGPCQEYSLKFGNVSVQVLLQKENGEKKYKYTQGNIICDFLVFIENKDSLMIF